jgi:hypothetical protein
MLQLSVRQQLHQVSGFNELVELLTSGKLIDWTDSALYGSVAIAIEQSWKRSQSQTQDKEQFSNDRYREFIRLFGDKIQWNNLSTILGFELIQEYIDLVNFDYVNYRYLPCEFVEKNLAEHNIYRVALDCKLTTEFIDKYKEILPGDVAGTQKLTPEQLAYFVDKTDHATKRELGIYSFDLPAEAYLPFICPPCAGDPCLGYARQGRKAPTKSNLNSAHTFSANF